MSIIKNPLLRGFYPDPSICRAGEDYYLVNSSFAYYPGIPVFHSRDLKNWKQIGNVLESKSQLPLENAGISEGIYAPTIRFHRGIFYVITTNIKNGGNFYVTAKNPAGPWSEPVYLDGAEGIDPSLFFDRDGSCYYIGTKERREGAAYFGDNEIWLQRLDLEKGKLAGESVAIWHGSMKHAIWPEGPHLYDKDGMYYLMIAEGGTEFYHSITIARSASLFGPYEGCPGNPVFTHRHLGRQAEIQNAGHGDLIQTIDGSWYMVLLASRMEKGVCNLGRETFLAKVSWENGWPVVNPGMGRLSETVECELPEEEAASEENKKDSDMVSGENAGCIKIDFTDGWDMRLLSLRGRRNGICELSPAENCLVLHTVPQTAAEKKIPAYVGLRQDSYTYSLETEMEFCPKDCDAAGLLLFQNEKNHIRLELVKQNGKYIVQCVRVKDGEETRLGAQELSGREETGKGEGCRRVFLCLEAAKQKLRTSYKKAGEETRHMIAEEIETEFLSTEYSGGFVGCTMGPYATGNGKEIENTARFYGLWYRREE